MRTLHLAFAGLMTLSPPLTARAESLTTKIANPASAPQRPADAPGGYIVLDAGGGRVFHTRGAIANLFVADPKVAEARPASPNSVFVFGVGAGRTTVAALDEAGNVLVQYNVVVQPSAFGANEAASQVRRALPGSDVRMSATPDGIGADGLVGSPAAAERVAAAARGYLGKDQRFDNRTSLNTSVQVTLRVRIAEISRNVTRQLGINWAALGTIGKFGISAALTDGLSLASNVPNFIGASFNDGKTSINSLLDLLAQDQLITMLAEPNLTARSGETASFLAGGEFPIPVSASNGQISIQFKQYGVSLAFVPTILSDGRISLHVRPEVSELTIAGAVSLPVSTGLFGSNVITIPALTVRRTDTTVELGSGQSFAIAGLLSGQTTQTMRGLPYLGEVPVLGALFKSDQFQNNKSELVIVITPYLVNPVSQPGMVRAPTDDFVPAGDVDRLLLLRQRARGTGPDAVRRVPVGPVPGPVALNGRLPAGTGFIVP